MIAVEGVKLVGDAILKGNLDEHPVQMAVGIDTLDGDLQAAGTLFGEHLVMDCLDIAQEDIALEYLDCEFVIFILWLKFPTKDISYSKHI